MSAWWVAFGAGWIAGWITTATVLGAKLTDRDRRVFDAGVQAERDGVAPRRPVADLPGFHHPTQRERGVSDVMIVLSALTVAGLVLLASGTFGGAG